MRTHASTEELPGLQSPGPGIRDIRPSVAVLVTVYENDRVEWVAAAIDSIAQQAGRGADFTVDIHVGVDGPVAEDLMSYLRSPAAGAIVHVWSRNRGLQACLNDLLDHVESKYDYIARMDADDVSGPERFRRQVEFLQSNRSIDLIGAQAIIIDEHGVARGHHSYPTSPSYCRKALGGINPILHPTYMLRAASVTRLGLRYPTAYLSEDLAFVVTLAERGGQFANLASAELSWRMTPEFFRRRSGVRRGLAELRWYRRAQRATDAPLRDSWKPLGRLGLRLVPSAVARAVYRSGVREFGLATGPAE